MPSTSGARTTAKGTIGFANNSLLRSVGKFMSVKDASDERDTKVFVIDEGGHKVNRVYVCSEGVCKPTDGSAGWSSLPDRGIMNGKTIEKVSADELAATKGSQLEKGLLEFKVCPSDEVDGHLWPSGSAMWYEPDSDSDPVYAFLCEAVADPTVALIGTMNLRDTDKTYRAMSHLGGIVVQEVLRPSEVHNFTAVKKVLNDAERAMGQSMVEALVEPFDPDEYASERVAAMRELIAAKTGGATVTPIVKGKKAAPAADDFTALLQASLAAAVAAKAAKAS